MDDEKSFVDAHIQLQAEGFDFGIAYQDGTAWAEFVHDTADFRIGRSLPEGYVAGTFLLAEVDGVVVGRTSIRHELNEFLFNFGGHIGYAVLPEHRRQGYATEILRQSIKIARGMGIEKVLVTCDDANIGSVRTIEGCGGALDNIVAMPPDDTPRRRYWIARPDMIAP